MTSKLQLYPVIKPDTNKLENAYEVVDYIYIEHDNFGVIHVPKYFQYDGASIPWYFWKLIGSPFHPKFMRAAVFHDWLYHTHQKSIEEANIIFYKLLLEDKVSKRKATLMYWAVKYFGRAYWDNDAEDIKYLQSLAQKISDDGKNPLDYGINDYS
jgi:hypothetical protein